MNKLLRYTVYHFDILLRISEQYCISLILLINCFVMQSSQSRLYIKRGQVVNHDSTFAADIYIEEGIIKYVGPSSDFNVPGGVRIIDAANRLILPGGIDPHTHMQLPFGGAVAVDDFYQGTKAAIAGGTTTISMCDLNSLTKITSKPK